MAVYDFIPRWVKFSIFHNKMEIVSRDVCCRSLTHDSLKSLQELCRSKTMSCSQEEAFRNLSEEQFAERTVEKVSIKNNL